MSVRIKIIAAIAITEDTIGEPYFRVASETPTPTTHVHQWEHSSFPGATFTEALGAAVDAMDRDMRFVRVVGEKCPTWKLSTGRQLVDRVRELYPDSPSLVDEGDDDGEGCPHDPDGLHHVGCGCDDQECSVPSGRCFICEQPNCRATTGGTELCVDCMKRVRRFYYLNLPAGGGETPGWVIAWEGEQPCIERDDEVERFDGDESAALFVKEALQGQQ